MSSISPHTEKCLEREFGTPCICGAMPQQPTKEVCEIEKTIWISTCCVIDDVAVSVSRINNNYRIVISGKTEGYIDITDLFRQESDKRVAEAVKRIETLDPYDNCEDVDFQKGKEEMKCEVLKILTNLKHL